MTPTSSPRHTPASRRLRRVCAALAAVLAAGAVAAAAAGATEATQFNISGRGFGHGIGMSQWGAYGYAKHGWKYAKIIKHYYTGVQFGKVANRTIRVLLADHQSRVRITAATPFSLRCGSQARQIPGGTWAVVTWSSGKYAVTAGAESWRFSAPLLFEPGTTRLLLANRNQNGLSTSANVHYRGALRVLRLSGGFSIINSLPLEKYLYGVVPRESPASWPLEALKAQAVAARSYAALHIGAGGPFDVWCSTRSQCYNGADGEAAASNAAVKATAGIVPTYGGKPISAFFFSTSGGYTESIENVWGTGPVPYLKGVPDPYDTGSPYHIWPENPIRRPAAAVLAALGSPYSPSGALQAIYVTRRGVSPRVVTAYVIGAGGSRAVTGATLRMKLGLRDTWFTVRTLSIDPSPRVVVTYGEELTLKGRTYPRLAGGEKLTLHYKSGGVWRVAVVPVERITAAARSLPGGLKARYSRYTYPMDPKGPMACFFAVGTDRSPQISVAVRPAVTLQPSATDTVVGQEMTFAASVAPVSMAGVTVALQRLDGQTWTDVGSGQLDGAAACSIAWTPGMAGTFQFRLHVPAHGGLLAANSALVTVNVTAAPSPAPTRLR